MRVRSAIFYVLLIFILGCSSINKYHQPKSDVSIQGSSTSTNNYSLNYYGKGSINYREELIIFLFKWINQDKIISIVIRDPFEINEIIFTLDKKSSSLDFKKISWGQIPIDMESFRNNLFVRKVLKEVLFWISKEIDSEQANKSDDYSCKKAIKRLYWQGRIDGCSQISKKINLLRQDLKINLFFSRQSGE